MLIGVGDNLDKDGQRIVHGLDPDYGLFEEKKDRNSDAYERYIRNLLENALPATRPLTDTKLAITFHHVKNLEICLVDVEPSDKPVVASLVSKRWSREKRDAISQVLFVRIGNMTQNYSMNDAARWISEHWFSETPHLT